MADPNELLFLRVVEAGSLKSAAEQMNLDPSVVSRRISSLESRLGVRLLQRSTRRSAPTEAGERYYEGLRTIVDEQMALESEVAGLVDTPRGCLRIAAPVDFGARFVAPVVADLQDRYPNLAVDLILGSAFADLTENGIDVAVRIGNLPDSSLIAKRIGSVSRVIVASKSSLSQQKPPKKPADLSKLPFIFYGNGSRELEIAFTSERREERVRVQGALTANSVTAIRTLVKRGRGLHLGPAWAFDEDLDEGSVVRVLPDYELEAFPLHALYQPSDFVPAKIRAFISDFTDAMRTTPAIETA